jgi:hypothetical protein
MAVLRRVCDDIPRPVGEVNADVPDWLEAILARLHAKDPADRFQSAAEVADLLGRHLAHLQQPGVVAPRVRNEGGAAKPQLPRARGRRVAAVLVLLAVAVLGVSAVVYQLLWRTNEVKTPDTSNGAAQEAPPWKPRPPLTLEELAKLPSPFDALKREAMELPEDAPPELLAVLGGFPRFDLPERAGSHWMARPATAGCSPSPAGPTFFSSRPVPGSCSER